MEEGIDIYLSNFSSVIFPKPSHYPSHSSVYAFERDWSRVNGIVIGTRLQTPCTFFELKFPINCSQAEQEPLSANLCTHLRAPDLNHQEKENPSLSPASGQVGFSQTRYATLHLLTTLPHTAGQTTFEKIPRQKRYPYRDRTGRIFPPGGYVAGTEQLVGTSIRVSANKGTWLKFAFSHNTAAAVYLTYPSNLQGH